MSLESEIKDAKHNIITDGYDMSIGELVNLYKDKELIINPNFQRYFVWSDSQKTRFIESIILGIPVPSIFVYQNEKGVWELVDGLQRLSTIFEFVGVLRKPDGDIAGPSTLNGTKMLPSLANRAWAEIPDSDAREIGLEQQLEIKRSRMRVEILKKESDSQAKFELFQRLNTGGTQLKPQEVRNAVMIMINKSFHDWLHELAYSDDFLACIDPSEKQKQRQFPVELALRFFVYRNVPYQSGLDVHEYIDSGMMQIATSTEFDKDEEGEIFRKTFSFLKNALGRKPFKKWDGNRFAGKFLISAYEIVAYGVSQNVDKLADLSSRQRKKVVTEQIKEIWNNPTYLENSGAGVRGTTRLRNLLPIAGDLFEA